MTFEEVLAKEYNPYTQRARPGQLGNIYTLINLIKGILGTGILALPEAFKQAGWLIGTIGNIALHLAVCYCLHIMFQAMYFMSKRNEVPYVSYADSLGQALQIGPQPLRKFSDCAPKLVTFFLLLYQFGTLCVYLVFSASNLKMVVDDNTCKESHLSLMCYMLLLVAPLLLLTYIKNLHVLAPFSNVANWMTVASLLIVYYFVFETIEPLNERNIVTNPISTALFIGTSMFSVLSIGIMLSLELNMKDGSKWLGTFGVLNQAIFIVTILDTVTGLFGYWRYGELTKSSITLNLGKNALAWSVQILYGVAILISYALQAYPLTEILWDQFVKQHMETTEHRLFWDYALRTIVVLLSFLIAVPIPFLGLFISLFGALCLSMLGIVFPPLMDICIRWEGNEFGAYKRILIRDLIFIGFGIFGGIVGSSSAVSGIIRKFLE